MSAHPSKTKTEWLLGLGETPLFRNLALSELEEIARHTQIEHYPSETILFHKGDAGDKLFIQLDGLSLLFLGSSEAPTVLMQGQAGDCFGEMAVIDHQPRSASLKTLEPTHFLTLAHQEFEQLMTSGHSGLSLNFMRFLTQRIRQTDSLLIEMLQKKNDDLQEALNLLQKTQKELLHQERLSTLGRTASMIVHDLKSPLTSVSTLAYVLTNQELPSPQRLEYGKLLSDEINRLVDMIEEILLFARESQSLNRSFVSCAELVARLRQTIELSTKEFPIAWEYHFPETLSFWMDEDKIHRVLVNLCKNAWEALMQAGVSEPRVTLRFEEQEGPLAILVQDNGPGIPEEIQDTLFEAFVTSGKSNGTGLGLAIVQKVIQDHQGQITCLSQPGAGTTFQIHLPALPKKLQRL